VTDNSVYALLAEQLLLAVAAIATLRQRSSDDRGKITEIKRDLKDLPTTYVPRLELQASLKSIERQTGHTNALVQALLYSGGDRKLAIEAIEAAAAGAPLMEYSECGMQMTESFETLALEAYWDSLGGVWTIGWGHTGRDVYEGRKITADQARSILLADLAAAQACVNREVRVALTQNQFDALVDFVFNVGTADFTDAQCHLLRFVNEGNFSAAAVQFGLWNHAHGRVSSGLTRRRAVEAKLFAEAE
jgi:lysozyme